MPNLDKANLNETTGLIGGDNLAGYGTYYFCAGNYFPPGPNTGTYPLVPNPPGPATWTLNANGPIDWNCDGFLNTANNSDVDADFYLDNQGNFIGPYNSGLMVGNNDWPALVYRGGSIGALAPGFQIPAVTPAIEITPAEASQLPYLNRVEITHPGILALLPGSTTNLTLIVTNTGLNADTYNLTGSSALGWGAFPALAPSVALAAGASTQIHVTVSVPAATAVGTTDTVTLAVISQASPIHESAEISIVADSSPNPVSLSVANLALDTMKIGSTGRAEPILVTNTNGTTLSISSIAASGDFSQKPTPVAIPFPPEQSCVINVTFTPTAPGTRAGVITITDNATGSPQSVVLTGMGTGSSS